MYEGDVYAATASILELILNRPLGRTPVLADRHEPWVELALDDARKRIGTESEDIDEVIDLLRRGLALSEGRVRRR